MLELFFNCVAMCAITESVPWVLMPEYLQLLVVSDDS